MNLREVVLGAGGRTLVDVDGEREVVALQPAVSVERLAEVERTLGFDLPGELRELLLTTAGLEMLESVDLASIGPGPVGDLFEWVLTPVGDGAGNFWVIEVRPGQEILGPVWFLCHDPPVLVVQSPDLATFLADYLRFCEAPHDGPVAEVVDGAVNEVWQRKAGVPRAALIDAKDEVLRGFARELPDGWFVCDLRQARSGDGMTLGRFGPRTPLKRAGREFVFAYGTRSRWQRLKTFFSGR